MRVMYGVCGDGMGHAMRSAVVAQHLVGTGHDVFLFSSGHAYAYLRKRFRERVTPIVGLSATIEKNKVDKLATVVSNVIRHAAIGGVNHLAAADAAIRVRPDVVISDFDPWSARYARIARVPLIALDNIHFMTRCMHPQPARGDADAAKTARPIVSAMVPGANHYLVLTFAGADIVANRTTLHAPVLRPQILVEKLSAARGDHVVVYFNAKSDLRRIVGELHRVPQVRFFIYGQHNVHRPEVDGNVTVMPFDERRFIEGFATCAAVIGGAGFTLMSESIYLGKPLLAVPFAGHYEQALNAEYLRLTEYGDRADAVTGDAVRNFLARAPQYAERLRGYSHDGNRELLRALDYRMQAAVFDGPVAATDAAAANGARP